MQPLDVESLVKATRRGEAFDYVLFWGHKASADGKLTSACFSQWWPAPFVVDDVRYETAEHWMMASKARLFGDHASLAAILVAESPAKVKKLGRAVVGFREGRWNQERIDVVTRGSIAKFSSTPELRAYLLDTGDAILVEASPLDAIWGIGLDANAPGATDPSAWRGKNLLGFALMRARATLRGLVSSSDP